MRVVKGIPIVLCDLVKACAAKIAGIPNEAMRERASNSWSSYALRSEEPAVTFERSLKGATSLDD